MKDDNVSKSILKGSKEALKYAKATTFVKEMKDPEFRKKFNTEYGNMEDLSTDDIIKAMEVSWREYVTRIMDRMIPHEDVKEDLLEGITEQDELDALEWAEELIKTLKSREWEDNIEDNNE